VLALLAAMVWPNLDYFNADARVVAAADMVRGQLAQARSHAVEEGRPYRFEIVDATHCRVVPDTGDAPAPGSVNNSSDENGEANEDTLPKNVTFDLSHSDAAGSDDNQNDTGSSGAGMRIVYLPDGSAREDAEIRLTSQGARSATLKLRALTGTIIIARAPGNKGP
jgi:Tfp pilus assembly protein FimT